MREDKHFRHYFDQVAIKEKPENPWRTADPTRAQSPGGRWRDEERPGRFSLLVYAAALAILAICVMGALPSGAPAPIQREVAIWWQANQVHDRVAEFLKQVAIWFPEGVI